MALQKNVSYFSRLRYYRHPRFVNLSFSKIADLGDKKERHSNVFYHAAYEEVVKHTEKKNTRRAVP
jgi:hypothetical protein